MEEPKNVSELCIKLLDIKTSLVLYITFELHVREQLAKWGIVSM